MFIELYLHLSKFHSRTCFVLLFALGRMTEATPPEPPPPAERGGWVLALPSLLQSWVFQELPSSGICATF